MGLRPGPFLTEICLYGPCGPGFSLKHFFLPSGRCSLWACGPRFSALQTLLSLGLRPGLFRPPGILPPAGNFLLAQKVPQKRLPPVALRGSSHHSQPSWGFPPPRPSARVAERCAKLGACQQCHLKPPRKICLAHNPPGAIRNSLEKYPSLATLLGLSSAAPISEGRGAL